MTIHIPPATEPGPHPPGLASPTLPDAALVPVRERHDGWTPARQRLFIETLADTGCVTAAAQAAGMTPQSAWRLRRRADARAFDAAWEAALERGIERLVSVALDRALNGTVRALWYHGEQVGEERVWHDGLLMALIRRGDAMLRHGGARRAMREDWEGAMAALEGGARDPAELSAEPYRVWDAGPLQLTNCPPGPDHEGWQTGLPYSPGYMRQLSAEETLGLLFKQGRDPEAEEARRRAMFGLDRFAGRTGAPSRHARRAAAARARTKART